ncbi:MAG TPA: hypothetical protein VFK02_13665 [Kofleriaceae bacterium]|nr:hypothetical protein [Kofleriaceae bacterium]
MIVRALIVVGLAACGTSTSQPRPRTFGGDRPAELEVPEVLQSNRRLPLVVVLHDYGTDGATEEDYFNLENFSRSDVGFLIAPEGMTDSQGKQFWNADPTCCDRDHQNPDDVGYVGNLIDQIRIAWPIDPKATMVIGYGNGGSMAYRLACERADVVSNVVVLSAPMITTPCTPTSPVNVLHIHGTADTITPYTAAGQSVQQWGVFDHCATSRTTGSPMDIDDAIAGNETLTESVSGCPAGISVELWTIESGTHTPSLATQFGATMQAWLSSHHRP